MELNLNTVNKCYHNVGQSREKVVGGQLSLSSSIVKVDTRHYRVIAQEHWGLTSDQMKGMHVHHRIPRSAGGTNDPSNLYVCTPEFHSRVWHNNAFFIEKASSGGKVGGKLGNTEGKSKGGVKGGARSAITRKQMEVGLYKKEVRIIGNRLGNLTRWGFRVGGERIKWDLEGRKCLSETFKDYVLEFGFP